MLCEPNGLCCNYSNKLLFYESSHNLHVDELAWLCSNKILFINKWVYPVDLTHDLQSANPWFKSSSYLTHILLFSFPSLTQTLLAEVASYMAEIAYGHFCIFALGSRKPNTLINSLTNSNMTSLSWFTTALPWKSKTTSRHQSNPIYE